MKELEFDGVVGRGKFAIVHSLLKWKSTEVALNNETNAVALMMGVARW